MAKESRFSPMVRPALIGTAAFSLFGVALIAGVIEGVFGNGFGLRFGRAVMDIMGKAPHALFDLVAILGGAYILGKSGERGVATHSTARYDPPARSDVPDDPDADHHHRPTRR